MLALARQTGDLRYREHAMREWWATTEFLYDPVEKLYYRDSRFFERRDAQERKLFWARGNGWVFAGMARSLPLLDENVEDRRRMVALFREMATRLVELQKPDGYWSPSLLAPEGSPPETSGTAFFTYGLAWGINAGLLDRELFEPAVRKGWDALTRAIRPDGMLGYVQQVSDRPEEVLPTDTQYYGVGAFLLAASEVARLDRQSAR
jgi:rhamnogalacturonyl hydrolase YesR